MLDLEKTTADFQLLSSSGKYNELVKIFSSIKEKNENCAYIYETLTTKPELFDDGLMEVVFHEVVEVYERMYAASAYHQEVVLKKSRSYLEELQKKEGEDKDREMKDIEAMLPF